MRAPVGKLATGFGDNGRVGSMGNLLLPEWNGLPSLGDGEVHVVALHAGGDPALLARAARLLTAPELERAARIRVERAREEFVVGRAALRVLLGLATGTHPELLPLEVDAFGKPSATGVHSNVSHSRGLVYVALCRAAPVGVDVEWVDPSLEALEIAEANFTQEETAQIAAVSAAGERVHSFCLMWTRKEAVAKADGRGLGIPLREIHVPRSGVGPAWIMADETQGISPGVRAEFWLQELPAPQGYVAALAASGKALPVTFLPFFSSDHSRV